jgi:hypothetical protein
MTPAYGGMYNYDATSYAGTAGGTWITLTDCTNSDTSSFVTYSAGTGNIKVDQDGTYGITYNWNGFSTLYNYTDGTAIVQFFKDGTGSNIKTSIIDPYDSGGVRSLNISGFLGLKTDSTLQLRYYLKGAGTVYIGRSTVGATPFYNNNMTVSILKVGN